MGFYDYSLTGGNSADGSNIDPTKKQLAAQMLRGDSMFGSQYTNEQASMEQERRRQQAESERAAAERRQQQDADSLRRLEDERRRQQEELTRSQSSAYQPQQSASPGGMPAMGGFQQMMGGGAGAGGAAGGGAGAGTSAGAGGSSAGGAMAGAAPWVGLAAAIGSHHMWAKNKGMHDNQDALLGRALYKDADWYQPRFNDKVDGWGDEVKLASLGSSPVDLFKANTWSDAAEQAAKGGILGAALKKLF